MNLISKVKLINIVIYTSYTLFIERKIIYYIITFRNKEIKQRRNNL